MIRPRLASAVLALSFIATVIVAPVHSQDLNEEGYESAPLLLQPGTKFCDCCKRQPGNDPDHNDQGNPIAYPAICDPFSQPHHEHGPRCKYYDRGNRKEGTLDHKSCFRDLCMQVNKVTGGL